MKTVTLIHPHLLSILIIKTLKEGKDYTVEKDVASITAKIKVNATSDISSQNIKVSVKDMAQNSGDGSVEKLYSFGNCSYAFLC